MVAASHCVDKNEGHKRGKWSEVMNVLDVISVRVQNTWFATRNEESGRSPSTR